MFFSSIPLSGGSGTLMENSINFFLNHPLISWLLTCFCQYKLQFPMLVNIVPSFRHQKIQNTTKILWFPNYGELKNRLAIAYLTQEKNSILINSQLNSTLIQLNWVMSTLKQLIKKQRPLCFHNFKSRTGFHQKINKKNQSN